MVKRSRLAGLSDGTEGTAEVTFSTPMKRSGSSKILMPKNKKAEATATARVKTPIKVAEKVTPKRNRIVVGLDLGTTFSGLSYVMTSNSDARDVQVVTDWTGGVRKNEQLEKVPTKYAYAVENEGLDEDAWGYEVEPWMKSYAWTKLLLDASTLATEFDNPHLQPMQGNGLLRLPDHKTAQEVIADFLRCLHEHIVGKLEKAFGESVLAITPVNFWITHPASWSDKAKHLTRDAAKMAGFETRSLDDVFLLSEPEAAAISILTEGIEKNKALFKTNTNVLISDLGGGTLDFQCLKIVTLEPLTMEEPCEGSGGKSGSTYIDFELHEFLESNFGKSFTTLPQRKTGAGSNFMEDFELVKKTFTGADLKKTFRLRLPSLGLALRANGISSTSYDFEDGEILITGEDVENMFKPVVQNALGLIREQQELLKKRGQDTFRVIAICGGLGMSKYIWSQYQKYCKETLNGEVELVTDDRAWSAVVRGAAIRGLEGNAVLGKKARRAYGIEVHQPFRKGIDKESDSFVCEVGGKRAEGYCNWFIRRGKKLSEKLRETVKVYIPLEDGDDELEFEWDLYTCSLDSAPAKINGKGVEKIGTIKVSLDEAFDGSYKRAKTSSNNPHSKDAVHITLALKMGSVTGKLEVEALYKRNRVGITIIDYSKDHRRKISRAGGLV